MNPDVVNVLSVLSQIAQAAQTSGLVPGGPATLVLTVLVAGLQATLATRGTLHPDTVVEIDDVGEQFAAAVARLRAAEPRP